MSLIASVNRYVARPASKAPRTVYVRPWALAAPVLILLICLPLLRPLLHPDPRLVSDDEQARLATIQAIVEHGSLAIEGTDFQETRDKIAVGPHLYSSQPPMLAVLLSGPYWIMSRTGLTFDNDPAWAAYWLTLLGVTLPVALSAGLVYRMARVFELRRPLRAGLGFAVVCGSGLISYATVLNSHAPAAALLLAAVACLFHATLMNNARRGIIWLAGAGACAALAACIDPPAAIFLVLLLPVSFAFPWSMRGRIAAGTAYVIAGLAPVVVHLALVIPVTGDARPGMFHPELVIREGAAQVWSRLRHGDTSRAHPLLIAFKQTPKVERPSAASADAGPDFEEEEPPTFWRLALRRILRITWAFIGSHGILTHFPVVLIGVLGVSLVMHRHWPATTKVLAAATVAGAAIVIIVYAMVRTDTREAMFATRWFIVFLPLLLFWSGVWLRKPHRQGSWLAAGVLLCFSGIVGLIGATGPLPRNGFDRYTVVGACENLAKPPPPAPEMPPILADSVTRSF